MDTSSPESAAAPARAASILHLVSPDAAQLARIAAPFLSGSGELRTLVLTADDESAVQVVHILVNNVSGTLAIVALTGAARAKRVLGTGVPPAAAMSLPTAAALIAQSALPLGEVRQLIVAMPRDPSSLAALDTVMAELPKGASRVLVAARETPEVEALVERHFFKTRRIREDRARVPESFYGEISVVGTAPAALWTTLRSLLEENDPPSCVVVAENEQSLADARRTLSALGYREDSHIVAAAAPPPEAVSLVVFAGLPSAAHVASAIAAAPASIVFLCAPREIESVRALVAPLVVRSRMLDGVRARAASREAATRGKLREILASGEFVAELSVIAPLLAEYDGSEVAAAALVLSAQTARDAHKDTPPPPAHRPPPPPPRPGADDRGRRGPPDDRGRRGPPDDRGRRGPPDDRGRRGPPDDRGRRGPSDDRGRRGPPSRPGDDRGRRGPRQEHPPRGRPRS